jgi:hypothetical protein
MKTEFEDVFDTITKEVLLKRGQELFDALVVKPTNFSKQLPEYRFVNTFLPYFCGEKNIEDQPTFFTTWISIAGTPANEVSIIDNNGKILFNVPPLMDTSVINKTNTGTSISKIIETFLMHSAVLPQNGTNFLNKHIDNKIDDLSKESTDFLDYNKRWNDIFVRYNKINAKTLPNERVKLDEDELIYE